MSDPLSVEYLHYHSVLKSPGASSNRGVSFAALAEALMQSGQPDEDAWPYQTTQPPSAQWSPPPATEPLYRAQVQVGKLDPHGIKAALEEGNSVVVGLIMTDAFMRAGKDGTLGVAHPDRTRGGHAVLAVGFGEDSSGALHILVRNSWGPGWGLDGHAWLSSTYLSTQLHETAILNPLGSEKWN